MTEQIASGAAGKVYTACPKCGHTPLPTQQSAPVACPGCGVIFAKIGQKPARGRRIVVEERWTEALNHVPERVDCTAFWSRCVLLAALAIWALVLIRLDYRVGEIGESFLHRPLLVFHEAGHVVFMPFGEWMTILGGGMAGWTGPETIVLTIRDASEREELYTFTLEPSPLEPNGK